MSASRPIYLGIDCGATTSKVCAIDKTGSPLSQTLRQRPTNSDSGTAAIVEGWMAGANAFLQEEGFTWDDVGGVGLAIPGPYLEYGVLGPMPNMKDELTGWHFLDDLKQAVHATAKRELSVVTANDGQLAGLAEARYVQSQQTGSVLMLAPGSGLGCSFVDASGQLLSGDHQAAVVLCHSPAPYEALGLPRFSCGCGRDWGCHEAYTSISGLPQYIERFLPLFPQHPFHKDQRTEKEKALSLRGLAQDGDDLALKIFDTQATALGLTVTAGAMAYDVTHVIIGGGLIDPDATTPQFRERYLQGIKDGAKRYAWTDPSELHFSTARLGELSQAIGAALLATRCS